MSQPWADVLAFLRANWQEIVGFLTGVLCVWLLVRESIWNWPVGIANNIFYIFIFLKSGLYADMCLQLGYITIALYGWWNWLHGGQDQSELRAGHASALGLVGYSAIAACSTAVLYWLLHRFTPSNVPFADGLTTSLFLTAQFMMSRKVVENWWFWIVGDVLVIGLYIYKHLYFTTVLYVVFLAMCVVGLLQWQKSARRMMVVAASEA